MAAVVAERDADPVRGPVLVNRPGGGEAEWARAHFRKTGAPPTIYGYSSTPLASEPRISDLTTRSSRTGHSCGEAFRGLMIAGQALDGRRGQRREGEVA